MPATTFIGHFLGPDTHANRPAAGGLPNGTLYVCTTDSKIERVVSGAWADYATLGGAAGLTLLSTTTLASAGPIDVSSISGSYNDLILVALVRGADAGSSDTLNLRLNGTPFSGNYYMQRLTGNATTASASQSNGADSFTFALMAAGGAPANMFAIAEITLFGYTTGKLKGIQWDFVSTFALSAGSTYIHRGGGYWNSTAAITRVELFGQSTTNLALGSQLRIYAR